MGIITPNERDGIFADLDAHIVGPSGQFYGGWASSLSINGTTINPTLESKVKSVDSPTKVAAFLSHIRIDNKKVIQMQMAFDTQEINNQQAAGLVAQLVGASQSKIEVEASIQVYQTLEPKQVLSEVSIKGYIQVVSGRLVLEPQGNWQMGQSHELALFALAIVPTAKTDLKVNFGGQANKVWTVSPATG